MRAAKILLSFVLLSGCREKTTALDGLPGDILKLKDGKLKVHPIEHGTFGLATADIVIYIDPVGGAERFSKLPPADLVLVTDIHGDHLDAATLKTFNKSRIIGPRVVADKLDFKIEILGNGKSTTFEDITIKALPMYNLTKSRLERHVKGRGNGYLLTMGGSRIYISGDTEDIPEMRSLKNIRAAFICMNLPYTMTVEQAASAVNEFKPEVVYPFHYRGKDGFSDVKKFRDLVAAVNLDTDVRMLDWYREKKENNE